jgi:hypothetical protein
VSDHILSLSTTVEPPKTFEVDSESYDLLGFSHLSPEDEARAQALFARFFALNRALDNAPNEKQGESFAKRVREKRLQILTMLTTMPMEVAERLPLDAQAQVFRAVAEESGQVGDELA